MNKYLIGKGREAEVYKINEQKVLKLFYKSVEKNIVQREFAISKELNNYSLPIPKFYGVQNEDGRLGLIYEYIKGDLLISMMIKYPFKISNYIYKFSLLHKQLHKVYPNNIPNLEEKLRFDIERQRLIDKKQTQGLIANLNTLCNEDEALLHWDYHPANIIVNQGQYKVIDWTGASIGPRIADVARTYMLFKYSYIDSTSPMINNLLEPIKQKLAKIYLANYAESQNEKDLVDKWLPIIATARLNEGISELEKGRLVRLINPKIRT